ncbi:hypothetical protein [Bartonella sp. WD16.2]|uniref:hypothetical protein n=1 Tax=Bartonella sp. WD16.2 TaxID=1933904 RepID=UPI00099B04A8|nr:hypothetical protein [Bartonella sp. WD16.2]AQX19235.1 hypothetical protein BWD162_000950 [Bartonella sp. WD16.2]
MVMRRVLKHHVCLCVLSTAIVAGLALITSQKVYAQQQQNCMGWVEGSETGLLLARGHDEKDGKIVCQGVTRRLIGVRTIDMSNPDDGEAIKITGSGANITIGDDPLTVTDKSNNSDKSAIRVEQGGR